MLTTENPTIRAYADVNHINTYYFSDLPIRGDIASITQYCSGNSITLVSYINDPLIGSRNSNEGGRLYNYWDSLTSTWYNKFGYEPIVIEITTQSLVPSYSIGDSLLGGIIFYTWSGGTHGLISALSDVSTSIEWGCSGTTISTGTAIGSGNQNTINILAGCVTRPIAGSLCKVSSDWYLPSKDEFYQMYIQKTIIGGFDGTFYWTSSEYDSSNSYIWRFDTNVSDINGKQFGTDLHVRAIRDF